MSDNSIVATSIATDVTIDCQVVADKYISFKIPKRSVGKQQIVSEAFVFVVLK